MILYVVLWMLTPFVLWLFIQHFQKQGYTLEHAMIQASWLTDMCKSVLLIGVIGIAYRRKGICSDHRSTWIQRKPVTWAVVGFVSILVYQLVYMFALPARIENGTIAFVTYASSTSWWVLNLVITGPIVEELFFRKVLYGSSIFGHRWIWRAIGSSLLFALFHADWMYYFLYFGMGLLFAMVYSKSRTITAPIAVHIALNGLVLLLQTVT